MAQGGTPEQVQVPQEIQDLVPHEFVLEAKRLLVQNSLRLDHDRVLERAAEDHPPRAERVHVALEHERSRRRDLLHEDVLVDVVGRVLRSEVGVVVFDREVDPEPIVRERHQHHAVLLVAHRLAHAEVAPGNPLIHDPRFLEHAHVRRGAPVARLGGLLGGQGDHEIVDLEPRGRREDVLHGVHFRVPRLQDRAAHLGGIGARVAGRHGNLRGARKIEADEADPRVGRSGTEFHAAGHSGMEPHALEGSGLLNGALGGGAHRGSLEPSSSSTRRLRARTVWMSSGRFRMLASMRFACRSGMAG